MSTFNESKVARTPAGSSDGGKFANKDSQREEAGQVALYGSSVDLLEDEELLSHSRRLAADIVARYPNHGENVEDVSQELAEMLLVARKNHLKKNNGEYGKWVDGAYLKSIAKKHAQFIAAKRIHPNDRKALAILRRREEEYLQEHGRAMPPSIREQVVTEITLNEPPGRRPIKGWADRDRRNMDVPLMVDSTSGGEQIENLILAGRLSHHDTYSLDESDTDPWATADQMPSKSEAWEALRQIRDLPPVATASVTPAQVRRISRDIGSGGGASIVFKRWQEGELGDDDPEVKAAFAPFGSSLSTQEADDVASMMVASRATADDLWRSCLRAATK